MIATASHSRSTSSSWWLEKTTGTPVAAYSVSTPLSTSTPTGSRPGERLVEDEQLGLVHERGRELDALLVAERELLDAVVGALGQPEPLDPAVGGLAAASAPTPVQRGEVDELGAHAHLRVQPALLRHVAEARAASSRRPARRASAPRRDRRPARRG